MLDEIKTWLASIMPDMSRTETPVDGVQSGALPPSLAKLRELMENTPLSSLLPYEYYDAESGVFVNSTTHGFVLEAAPLVGANPQIVRVLNGLFAQNFPKRTGIQFMLWGSPNVQPILSDWAAARQGEHLHAVDGQHERRSQTIYRQLARRRVAHLRKGMKESLFPSKDYTIKNFRLIISVTFPGEATEDALRRAKKACAATASVLTTANMPAEPMGRTAFINLIYELLNPDTEEFRASRRPNDGKRLKHQMICPETDLQIGRDGMVLNNTEVRGYSVTNYPTAWPLWGMQELIGDSMRDSSRLPGHFVWTLGVYIPDQEVMQGRVSVKAMRATQNADSPMAKWMPHYQQQKHDWDVVQGRLSNGDSLVYAYHEVLMFTRLGDGERAEQALKSLGRANGWSIYADRYRHIQALLAALPMSLSPNMYDDLNKMGRMSTMLTSTAANMIPALAEWRGTGSPLLLLAGRRGQLQYVDPWDNKQGNYNVAIAAASGAGKSFLAQEYVASVLGTGGRAWVIDRGRSYLHLCELLGGQFIEFTHEAKLNLNPFTHPPLETEEQIRDAMSVIKPLVGRMARQHTEPTDLESSFLEETIKAAIDQKHNDATITTVADNLLKHSDPRANDLGHCLLPYTKDGQYARFFEGRNTLDMHNQFVVLEMEELANDPGLRSIALMILMFEITTAMYRGERTQRKVCLIDEAWQLMEGPSGSFIVNGYRVARKYGGAFVTITQSIGDYHKSEGTRAALANSDFLVMLRQNGDAIEQIENNKWMLLDEHKKTLLKSLTKIDGEYSELLVQGPDGYAEGRLIVDPFSALLYSTKAQEFAVIQRLQSEGFSLMEAIENVLEAKRHEAQAQQTRERMA